jgi:transaldolase
MSEDRLKGLADEGVSIWLDDLSRERLNTGNLEGLIKSSSVSGVTTNPTIFASALSNGAAYNDQVRELAARDTDVADAIKALTSDDVRHACDLFKGVYEATGGVDGRVSIEVEPGLAMDTEGTSAQASDLWKIVDRPNVLIKIPATKPGLPAIKNAIGEGISVNVTLIFSLERYRAVMDAYLSGLEQAAANGHDLSRIQSVASFFISRVDTEVDKRLDAIGSDEAKGANRQRPLWASTGVKDPNLPDTLYVTELVVANTVNTMPEKTMQAFADHGELSGDRVSGTKDESEKIFAQLEAVGVDLDDVWEVIEKEGVDKFDKSWGELVETVQTALDDAKKGKTPGESTDVDDPNK